PTATPSPYTTLFRSSKRQDAARSAASRSLSRSSSGSSNGPTARGSIRSAPSAAEETSTASGSTTEEARGGSGAPASSESASGARFSVVSTMRRPVSSASRSTTGCTPLHEVCCAAYPSRASLIRVSTASVSPCSTLIDSEAPCAVSHAVAVIEQTATSAELAISRASRLCRSGTPVARCRLRRPLGTRVPVELVAHPEHRHQPARRPRVRLELLAQVLHVHVDAALGDEPVDAVDVLQQPGAGEHVPGARRHRGEQ